MLGAGWIDLLPLGTGRSPFLFDAEGGVLEVVAAGLFIAVTLNLLLGVFNLLPIPPLDGAALPGLFLDTERRYQFRMWGARYALIGLVLSWYVVGMVFRPVYGIVLRWVFAP